MQNYSTGTGTYSYVRFDRRERFRQRKITFSDLTSHLLSFSYSATKKAVFFTKLVAASTAEPLKVTTYEALAIRTPRYCQCHFRFTTLGRCLFHPRFEFRQAFRIISFPYLKEQLSQSISTANRPQNVVFFHGSRRTYNPPP